MKRNQTVFRLAILVTIALGCSGKHSEPRQIPSVNEPSELALKVENSGSAAVDGLVARLVSKRPAPFYSGYSPWSPSEMLMTGDGTYRTSEVRAAANELKKMGPGAFPYLVKHLNDDRYSYSFVSAAWLNAKVGQAVLDTLSDGHYMHSGYKSRRTSLTTSALYLSFRDYIDAKGVKPWADWAAKQDRLAIQMDFIDWCEAEEEKRGFIDDAQHRSVLKVYEDARARVRAEYAKPVVSETPNK
jgi:hypothetical protein